VADARIGAVPTVDGLAADTDPADSKRKSASEATFRKKAMGRCSGD